MPMPPPQKKKKKKEATFPIPKKQKMAKENTRGENRSVEGKILCGMMNSTALKKKKSESSFAMAMMQMLSNETGSEKTNPLKTQAIFHICDYKMVLKVTCGQML